jgi:hypothetical protein
VQPHPEGVRIRSVRPAVADRVLRRPVVIRSNPFAWRTSGAQRDLLDERLT